MTFFLHLYFTLTFLLYTFIFQTAYSQTSAQVLEFAQSSFGQKNYEDAIESCERIIFFEERKEILASAYLQLAYSNLEQNNYDLALDNFSKIKDYSNPGDSIALEAEFGKIICHIMRNDPHYAMMCLLDLKSQMPEYFERKKMFYVAVVNYKINDLNESERGFIELLNNSDTVLVKNIFLQLKKEQKKINPHKAKILSMVIPGAGQFYLGDYPNAVKSFLLNASIIAVGIHFASAYTVLDSLLFTSNWFLRYYKGGFLKARLMAENKLKSATNSSLNQVLELAEKVVKEKH